MLTRTNFAFVLYQQWAQLPSSARKAQMSQWSEENRLQRKFSGLHLDLAWRYGTSQC